jgi:hypothetical protein
VTNEGARLAHQSPNDEVPGALLGMITKKDMLRAIEAEEAEEYIPPIEGSLNEESNDRPTTPLHRSFSQPILSTENHPSLNSRAQTLPPQERQPRSTLRDSYARLAGGSQSMPMSRPRRVSPPWSNASSRTASPDRWSRSAARPERQRGDISGRQEEESFVDPAGHRRDYQFHHLSKK